MNLYFHGSYPLNMKITNSSGQILYKVETPPWKPTLETRVATVYRVIPNNHNPEDMRDRFVELGQVKFNTIQPSVLCFDYQETSVKDFFQSDGLSLLGYGRQKTWVAKDGRRYTWKLGIRTPTLYDEAKNQVVIYHLPFLSGTLQKDPEVYLEIKPGLEQILDQIILTFVYVEKWRQDSE